MNSKPHRGTIHNWLKHPCLNHDNDPPTETFYISGEMDRHPVFGNTTYFSSSWVVKQYKNEIETRNSRYTLGKPNDH